MANSSHLHLVQQTTDSEQGLGLKIELHVFKMHHYLSSLQSLDEGTALV